MTNLAALNQRILLDPAAAVNDPRFSPLLHLHEDPAGATLNPLATGLAMLELHGANADVEQLRECYEEGIQCCFVSGISVMDHAGSDSDHRCEEKVNHAIEVPLGGRTIVLEFESKGSMNIIGVTGDKHYPVALDTLLADLPGALVSPTALHAGWAATHGRAEPFAYPEDSGWEIGGIGWKLTRIGGLPVEGPEIFDCNVGWDDCTLSEDYKQRYHAIEFLTEEEFKARLRQKEKEPRQQSFCFLHYLDEEQARALGLARPEGTVWQPARKGDAGYYPDWVSDDLDLEATWIVRDELIESYRESTLLFDTLTVFIGASETVEMVEENWRTPLEELDSNQRKAWARIYAGDADEGEEDEDATSEVAVVLDPETRLRHLDRLFSFPIGGADETVPADLTRIVANLQRLRRAAYPGP